MADPTGVHSDGFLAFGSQTTTFTGITGTFIADDINIDTPTTVLTRRNEVHVPQAETQIVDVITGNMTLQLPDATSATPTFGTAFTLKAVGGATMNFKVGKTGQKFSAGGETKIMVEFRQRFATS